jgi:hypothetical protein
VACYLNKCIKSSLLGHVLGAAIVLGALAGCSEQSAPKPPPAKAAAEEDWSVTQQRLKDRKKERDAKNKAVCLETIGKAKCEEVGYVFD